jgi:tetratricopeptide (TPR) repeat protein
MDWSYELLDSESRLLFARVSAFHGGFDLAAAEAICGFDPLEPVSVANILTGLVAKSLIRAKATKSGTRYLMNETARRYASHKLDRMEGAATTRQAHASFFLQMAQETPEHMPGPNEQDWIQVVRRDSDNLRASMEWYLERGEAKQAQALAASLHRYFLFSMRMSEGLQWAERALAASDEPSAERAGALLAAGTLGNSVAYMNAALDLADALGMEAFLDSALYHDRTARLVFGEDWKEAESLYRRSLGGAEKRGDRAATAMALLSLGYYALSRSDLDGALELMTRSVDAAEQSGSIHLQVWALCGLLRVQQRNSDLQAASRTAATLARQDEDLDGDPDLLAYSLLFQGAFALDQGRVVDAAEMLREAIQLRRRSPDHGEDVGVWSQVLVEGSRLFTKLGNPSLGALLVGANETLIEDASYVLRPYQVHRIEAASVASRKALAHEEFESNRDEGRHLSLAEAVDRLLTSIS